VKEILTLLKLLRGTTSLLESLTSQVNVKQGLAAESLKSMIQNGEGASYDFAFVDADKRMYQDYFELLLQLVR
jgi:predicted O-methyltransferase YrrM